jgi:hypothetical protein
VCGSGAEAQFLVGGVGVLGYRIKRCVDAEGLVLNRALVRTS